MRQLHVVALSEDGRSVLLATSKTAKTGAFTLPLDAKLAAALRGDVPRTGEQQAREFDLTPKEIQARLRAGESPEQIAQAAGVPVARVERFAGPVLSERERIIEEARAGFISRNRRGPSQLPLGDAVDAALAGTSGLRSESVTWTARRLESGHWLVQVSYVARARTRTASWVYEPHTRAVTASDATSAVLGHVGDETGPRRLSPATPAAKPVRKKPAAAKKPAAKKAVKKAAAKPAAAKPAKKAVKAAPTPAAKRVAAKKAAKKAAATKVAAKPVSRKPVAHKPVAKKKKAVARKRTPKPADLAGPPTLRVVPSPVVEPQQHEAPKRRAAGERAHVPDWADVLLGIAPKRSDD